MPGRRLRFVLPVTATALVTAAAIAAVEGSGSPIQAQLPQAFRGGVEVVQLEVSVLDRDRRPVRDLTPSEVTVLEDGRPRPLVAFVPVTVAAPAPPAGTAAWLRDVPPDVGTNGRRAEGRLVVILFDWSIRPEDQALARRIATAVVDALGPDDLAAVVFSSGFANGGTPQNFTADRGRLLAAIARPFAAALHNPPVGPGHDPRNGNDVMIDDPEGYEAGDCLCRVCVPETIARIADTVRDVHTRRKTMIFIGTYFRSYEALQGPISRPPPGPPAAITGIVRPSPYAQTCAAPLKRARERMVRATSLANLTVHTLDPVGLETASNSPMGGSAQGMRERQDDLAVLADLTGGRSVVSAAAPDAQVPALLAESGSYYLVAFAPADTRRGDRPHAVNVKVARRGVTVRTASGYYPARTDAPAAGTAEAPAPIVATMGSVLPRSELPLMVAVAPFAAAAGGRAPIAIVLGAWQPVPAADEPFDGRVTVVTAAFDRNGRSVHSETQTIGLTWPPAGAAGLRYEVLSRLALDPGHYEIRVAVDGGVGRRASVHSDVDVPDLRREVLALSGLVLAATPAMLAAPRDAFADLMPVVPTARRRFARTDAVSAFLRVYQRDRPGAAPVAVAVRLVDADDRVVWTDAATLSAGAVAAAGGAPFQVEVPLRERAPGDYLLVVEAARGPVAARQRVRLTIE